LLRQDAQSKKPRGAIITFVMYDARSWLDTMSGEKARRRRNGFRFESYRGVTVGWIVAKYLMTATVVVVISEIAKRSDKLGGLIAALPLVTILSLVWLHIEKQPQEKISNHAWYTFWYVVPTLPMFLVFPVLLPRAGFWPTLATCIAFTAGCFWIFATVLRKFGIELL